MGYRRSLKRKSDDRLFILKVFQEIENELGIDGFIIFEKIVLAFQILMLDNNLKRIFSYRFVKIGDSCSDTILFEDYIELKKADFIRMTGVNNSITKVGKKFIAEFTYTLNHKQSENFEKAIRLFKDQKFRDENALDEFIVDSPIVLCCDLGEKIFANY